MKKQILPKWKQALKTGLAVACLAMATLRGAAQFTTFSTTGSSPRFMVFDASGNLYVANYSSNTVTKITPGGVSSTFASTGSQPYGIAIDALGNLYVTNAGSNSVTKITPGGVATTPFASTGAFPIGITVDGSGNIYTANNSGSSVTKISSSGTVLATYSTGANTGPVGIKVDGLGNIWTANDKTGNNTVSEISPTGVVTSISTSSVYNGTSNGPNDLVIDASNNVYVTIEAGKAIAKITQAGIVSQFGPTLTNSPFFIAIDGQGNLYVTDPLANSVTKINAAGTTATDFSGTGNLPVGIAIDGSGYIYTSNQNANTVSKSTLALLPITLSNFSGVKTPAGNLINWTASNAVNFAHFELQRSTSGSSFATLATVAVNASGSYSYTDASAIGTNYYRLAMVDLDGSTTYSNTVAIVGDGSSFAVASIYPNPTASLLNIALYTPATVSVTYTITDISGRVMSKEVHAANAATTQQINVSNLARGTYLITVDANGTKSTSKFTKL